MHLTDLHLTNFKNLNQEIVFQSGINLITAPNGSGKTNILESIYILGNSTSFNSYPDINLINFDRPDFTKIKSVVGEHTYEVIISNIEEMTKKKFLVDGSAQSATKFSSNFDVLLFSPTSVDLVAGAPDTRRSQLDDLISSLDIEYKKILTTYKSVVKNRNKLLYKLKYNKGSIEELAFWDEKLVKLGTQIIIKRLEIIKKINNLVNEVSENIFHTNNNKLQIKYIPTVDISENIEYSFEKAIVDRVEDEIRIGYTLFGPHRDDFEFNLSGQNARISASRGQQRISSLLFSLSAWDIIYKSKNQKPLLLLDDIMSELDKEHQKNIIQTIKKGDYGQIIISTSEENDNNILLSQSNIIKI